MPRPAKRANPQRTLIPTEGGADAPSAPPAPAAPAAPRVYGIGEITRHLAGLFDKDPVASDVWVRGEISNFKAHTSGHWYFSLKDAEAVLGGAMFRGANERVPFRPEDGLSVFARGTISIYPPRGNYQLVVKELRPDGAGAKALALEALKRKLHAEGLFDPARKRDLPALPQRIGVITSLTGAAVRDIITVATRRFPPAALVIRPVKVQGEGSPEEIAEAIRFMNEREAADVLIVGRGGGSIEDLWAFNEELVVRAIATSRIPVVSAVGHETDVTLADLAADLRAATPSAAAEAATPDAADLLAGLAEVEQALRRALSNRITLARARLDGLERSPSLQRPEAALQLASQRVDDAAERLRAMARLTLERKGQDLAARAALLDSLSPLRVLSRGYAVATTTEGRLLTRAADAPPGARIRVRLHEGRLDATVTHSEESP